MELWPIAERLLAQFEGAFSELAHFVAGRRGRVTVEAPPSIAAGLLPAAIAALHATHPDVEVVIRDGLSDSVLEAVAEGRAEIGLTVQPIPSSKLHYQLLVEEEFGLVCRADRPLAALEEVRWAIFTDHPFIAMAPASSVRAMTDAAFLQAGLAVPPLYECSFLGTAGHLIKQGLGITAMPRLVQPLVSVPNLVWRPLRQPVIRRQTGAVTRVGRSLSPAAMQMMSFLQEAAKEVL